MQDIQIICVNDGSPDNSRTILQEYADRDSRIEIIDQENQCVGSARNAAYPYIRGKYTYFVDPDDWIELDICEQCYNKAEATGADFVAIRQIEHKVTSWYSPPFDCQLPEIRQSLEEKREIFGLLQTWRRFWRSDFLLLNNIRFPEGKYPSEDIFVAWKGTALASRIAVLNSPLYHYRIRPGSAQSTRNDDHFIVVERFNEVEKMLYEIGQYESCKNVFFVVKWKCLFWHYPQFSSSLRFQFCQHIRWHLTDADRECYRTAPKKLIPKDVKLFYEMVAGGPIEAMNYHVSRTIRSIVGMPERLLRQWIVKPLKKRLKAA